MKKYLRKNKTQFFLKLKGKFKRLYRKNNITKIILEKLKQTSLIKKLRFQWHLIQATINTNKNPEKSTYYWRIVINTAQIPKVEYYLNLSNIYLQLSNDQEAYRVLQNGRIYFKKNELAYRKLVHLAKQYKDWETVIFCLKKLIECSSKENQSTLYKDYLHLYTAYINVRNYHQAEIHVSKMLKVFPHNNEIKKLDIDVSIYQQDWSKAIEKQSKYMNPLYSKLEERINLSILYKVNGQHTKFQNEFLKLLEEEKEELKNDKLGYRKIIIFDNGESRIEFYKTLKNTESVIVTFDSINMEWQNPSFAFKLLIRQNIDIIAIRKKKKKTYQQDLKQKDFLKVVTPLIKAYKDKMAYGFSLGAYNALYFASLVNCRILAFSPRLSIHPKFGRTKIIPKYTMEHNLTLPYKENIEPIIVFDPKNNLDNKYIMEGVLPSFPNAKLIKIPYGGHGIAPHLLKMGVLKKYVITFINKEIPYYDRKLKIKSYIYFRNLGSECLKHNKLSWALHLAETSLSMEPSDLNGIKLKIKVLKRLNKINEAKNFTKKAASLLPNNLDLRLYLVDIYLDLEEYQNAQNDINTAIKMFGKQKNILRRQKRLKNVTKIT